MSSDCLIGLSCFLNIILAVAFAQGWRTMRRRLDGIEARLQFLNEEAAPSLAAPSSAAPTGAAEHITPVRSDPSAPSVDPELKGISPTAATTLAVTSATPFTTTDGSPISPLSETVVTVRQADPIDATDAPPGQPLQIEPAERHYHPLIAWFVNMHVMVQIGLVVLFFGVGFLVKYAADQGWFPLEVRLASAAALGAALAAVGWRLRERRRTYGLALIGGGIGIVYLTTFGAYFFYALLPSFLAFAIFVTLSLIYATMALVNNAPILAFLAIVGAFLAPWLAAESNGSHLVLFSYYGVVNCGVLAIARYKQWSNLNLASFALSATAATVWAAGAYQPAHFGSTLLFLTLFFGFYLLITLWQATQPMADADELIAPAQPNDDAATTPQHPRRFGASSLRQPSVSAVILLFANPVVSFLLAAGLLKQHAGWLAYGALALTVIYAFVALGLRDRSALAQRFVADSSFFFAAFFLTIAVPLRFDAELTAAIWSVMGVGLVGLSIYRASPLLRGWGILVHLLAMIAYISQSDSAIFDTDLTPYLNHFYLSTLILSLTTLTSAALLHTHSPEDGRINQWIANPLLLLGLLWWYGGGLAQFSYYFDGMSSLALLLLYLIISALLADWAGLLLNWQLLRWPMLTVLPSAIVIVAIFALLESHPFDSGWYVWLLLLLTHLWMLYSWRRERLLAIFHAGGLWLIIFLLGWRLVDTVESLQWGDSWTTVARLALPLIAMMACGPFARYLPWPIRGNQKSYIGLGTAPIFFFVAGTTAITAFTGNGDSFPLPFAPLVNPLDITLFVAIAALASWVQSILPLLSSRWQQRLRYWANWLLAGLVLLVLNGALARTIHHLLGVPYTFAALFDNAILQMGYALLWSGLALALMLTAHRRHHFQFWMIGATILGLTVVKLFLIDLAQTGRLTRIISFIGVGLLIITIAYFWPAPPRTVAPAEQGNAD